MNRKIRKAWLETRLQEAVAQLDSDVEYAHSIVQDTNLSALLEDKKPAAKTNFVWNEFKDKYWRATEEFEKQLEDTKESIRTKFRWPDHCLPENPDLIVSRGSHYGYYDLKTYKLKVADESIDDEDEEWWWIKQVQGADEAVATFKTLQKTVKQRKEKEKSFNLGDKLVRAENNRSLSQLLKQDRNRFEREYNEAEKNSLPARQLLFEGNESSQTIQDREWQEFYFFSLLLKGRSAQEILPFLEPCKGDFVLQLKGHNKRKPQSSGESILDECVRQLGEEDVLLPSSMKQFKEVCMKKITAYLSPESWKNFLETLGTVDRDGQSMSLIDYFYKQQATAPHVDDAATNEPPLKKARKVPSIEESPAAAAAATAGLAPGDYCEQCKMTIGSISAKEKEYKRKCRDLFLFH